nr:STAS domain-containing protein [Paracoccus sp. MC1854]
MTRGEATITGKPIRVEIGEGVLAFSGDLSVVAVGRLDIEGLVRDGAGAAALDIGRVRRLDTAGGRLLLELQRRLGLPDCPLALRGASEAQAQLVETVRRNLGAWTCRPARRDGTPRRSWAPNAACAGHAPRAPLPHLSR